MKYDGLAPAALASRLRTPNCIVLPTVNSTLDVLHEIAVEGAPARTVVLADEQLHGRGRHGRNWHSPKGQGIWLAYLMRPVTPIANGVLALRVGLAIAETLRALSISATLKWPNDVLCAGKKVCGVLCETRWQGNQLGWVAVGVGINVHGPLPPEVSACAAALDETTPGISRIDVLDGLVPKLHLLPSGSTLSDAEREAYRSIDWLGRHQIAEPVQGRPRGVDRDGALLVETTGGVVERVVGGTVVVA